MCCSMVTNPDVAPLTDDIVAALASRAKTPACIDKLLGTTFVSTVDSPTLSVLVPLMSRGLGDPSSAYVVAPYSS